MIIVPTFRELFIPARYKTFYGGRGGAKSWNFARALLLMGEQYPLRVLCAREFQTSIADSVHKLLSDQIADLGLDADYEIGKTTIRSNAGAEFIFKGLRHNSQEIKSTEGIDIAWIEEAETVSNESWDDLIPTIRKESSEIWLSFNTKDEQSPTYQRFVVNPPPGSIVRKVGFADNPFFPAVLESERLHMLKTDPERYDNVWGGNPRKISEAVIFKGKYCVDEFTAPYDARFLFGADWGFSLDPTVLIRAYIRDNILYVDHEAYGYGVDIDDTPALFRSIPGSQQWPIKADGARPETISYMRRQGFNISEAKKWSGSVEDGIAFMRSFNKIVIHPRCKNLIDEFATYSYKVDPRTQEVLPIIVDKRNHGPDAIRYGLDGYIKGKAGLWESII